MQDEPFQWLTQHAARRKVVHLLFYYIGQNAGRKKNRKIRELIILQEHDNIFSLRGNVSRGCALGKLDLQGTLEM